MADTFGIETSTKLEDVFKEYCVYLKNLTTQQSNTDCNNTWSPSKRKSVVMTQAKYTGTQEIIYVTHSMP